ncbi:PIN domain-containing protein [Methylobacterium sp. NEAU 140]|uniref:PIN domain-containing protein n=1 Tax=Methylobacterium sp. NEAU 140 TaxID=3064945 RepID=UPI0027337B47|nr:PIN domain-containing protein [Methylobacterium sp. NEAU 140]MDP4026993.1 PIN domain-containing protein [Methylobacterium sp. NEAU 140]
MSPRYLLDTNSVSDLIKYGEQSIILDMVRRVGDTCVCTSVIVAAEIRFGVERKGSDKLRMAAARVLGALPVLPIDLPAAMRYAVIRAHLEGEGRGGASAPTMS